MSCFRTRNSVGPQAPKEHSIKSMYFALMHPAPQSRRGGMHCFELCALCAAPTKSALRHDKAVEVERIIRAGDDCVIASEVLPARLASLHASCPYPCGACSRSRRCRGQTLPGFLSCCGLRCYCRLHFLRQLCVPQSVRSPSRGPEVPLQSIGGCASRRFGMPLKPMQRDGRNAL